MKKLLKIFFATIFCFVILTPLFSFNINYPTVISVRESGYGGYHVADTSSYYSFIANPANISLAGRHILFPSIQMNACGNLQQLSSVATSLLSSKDNDQSFVENLLSTISSEENINLGTDITSPLSFGSTKNNFGWGFFNRIYGFAEIPSINTSNILGGTEFLLKMGYSYPIKLPLGITLSFGICFNGFYQLQGVFTKAPTELLNFDFLTNPVQTILGYGFDLGTTIQVFKIFRLGIVWENMFGQTFVSEHNTTKDIFKDFFKIFTDKSSVDISRIDWNIKLGLAVDIPIKALTRGFISNWIVAADCNNIMSFITKNQDPLSRNKLLELSFGTEFAIFNTLIFRFGINENYMGCGFGIKLENLRFDFAAYGKELGLEPGSVSQLNMGFSISIQK